MEVSKGKKILYSLWMVPIFLEFVLGGLMSIICAIEGEFEPAFLIFQLLTWLIPLGFLFLAITTKQKKDYMVFFLMFAVFGVFLAINQLVGSHNQDAGAAVGFYLWLLYSVAGFVYALLQRKRAVTAAAYVRTPEYKQEMLRKQQLSMENEKRKLRGEKPVSAASAATASRFAAAVGAPAAPAAPAAPVTPAAPVAPAAPAAPAAPVVSAAPKAAPVVETAAAAEPPKRVDVNRCTTQELLELPGMALADASRIVKEREANGPFASVEDCVARVGLKPHLSVRYIGFLTASTAAPASHTRRGRTLDL